MYWFISSAFLKSTSFQHKYFYFFVIHQSNKSSDMPKMLLSCRLQQKIPTKILGSNSSLYLVCCIVHNLAFVKTTFLASGICISCSMNK